MSDFLFTTPDVGEGIAEVELMGWHVEVGQSVEEDQLLCAVMTDKAVVEIPSPVAGKVTWIGCESGTVIAVGSQLIRFATLSTDQATEDIEPPQQAAKPLENEHVSGKKKANTLSDSRIKPKASPSVRRRARQLDINLADIAGSGPGGRILHADLTPAEKRPQQSVPETSANEIEYIPLTGLRRKIASSLQATKQRVPHFSYVEETDVSELMKLRERLNERYQAERGKLTILPFVFRAVIKALEFFPNINARFDEEQNRIERHQSVHMGFAAQTDVGLMVPVIRQAQEMDIWQLAKALNSLSEAARSGSASREQLSGSTITVTSLGALGGIVSTPVINAPEVSIIGVNKVAVRPVWQDGQFVPRQIMNLSSSFDHRWIDGYEAAQFIQTIKGYLESPAELFIAN